MVDIGVKKSAELFAHLHFWSMLVVVQAIAVAYVPSVLDCDWPPVLSSCLRLASQLA